MNDNDEAVLVSSDIEYDEFTDLIRTSEDLSHSRKILPTGILNRLDPIP
jgi:hypothetical protein